MLVRPRLTLASARVNPRWGVLLLVLTVLAAAAGAVVFSTEVGRQALVDQWERTAFAFGRPLDEDGYRQLLEWSEHAWLYGVANAVLGVAGLTIAAAAVIVAVLGRPPEGRFRHVLAVAAHAAVILGVRHVVAAPLIYLRETTTSATTLVTWFPLFDESSPAARLLGTIDLFVIWWVMALAYGVSMVYDRPFGRTAAALLGAYAALALALVAAMALAGGTA